VTLDRVRRERARTYAEAARADRTQRAYRSDLAHFQKWTCAHGETLLAEVSAIVPARPVRILETLGCGVARVYPESIKTTYIIRGEDTSRNCKHANNQRRLRSASRTSRRSSPKGRVFRTFNGGKKLTANRIAPIDVARVVKRLTLAAGIEGLGIRDHSVQSQNKR
jgi:hypothetical protein